MIEDSVYSFIYLISICVYGATLLFIIKKATKKK